MTRRTDDRLRALYQSTPNAVILLDDALCLRSCNPAAQRLFGPALTEMTGKTAQILFAYPRDFDQQAERGFGLHHDRIENTFNARYRSLGGRVFDGETVAVRVEAEDPVNAPDVMLIIRDVSAELTLKAKLEASDIQLRAALASANEGAFSLNLVTGLGSTRGFINEFLGIATTDATISLDRWLGVIAPNMRDTVDEAIQRLRKHPTEALDQIFRAKRADGVWRWLHMRGRVTEFMRDGTSQRISGVVSDVTERQALEEKLAERERQLANAIEAGSCGVWEFRPSTRQITPFGEIRDMLGLEDDEVAIAAERWTERTHPDEREAVSQRIRDLVAGDETAMDLEYRFQDIRTNEWVWLRSRGRMTRSSNNEAVVAGVLTDVTERKEMEAAIAESEVVLREAVDSANAGTWNWDVQSGMLRVSGFVVPLLGLGELDAELSFDDWMKNAPNYDKDRVFERHQALKNATRNSPQEILGGMFGEFPMISADGSEVWLRSQGRIVEWTANGHPKRLTGVITNISEEHRLSEALRQSESRLRDALRAANEGAWRLDLRQRIAEITAVISEMVGLPASDARISYDDWLERVHPEDRKICNEGLDALIDGSSDTVDYIVRYRSEKDGWIHVHNRGRVSERAESGKALKATGFITNASDRIEAEKRLAERDQQISEAVDAAALGTWRYDYNKNRITLSGSVVAALTGSGTQIEFPQQSWTDLIHPEDLPGLGQMYEDVMAGKTARLDAEYRLHHPDGKWYWYKVTGKVVETDENGRPTAGSGVVWNIDAARRVEIELEEKRERFERIYRASPAMMHTIDKDGYIVEVSDYWLAQLGYQRHEVIGRKSVDFLDEKSRAQAIEENLPFLFEHGYNTNLSYGMLRKDGSVMRGLLSSFLERDENGDPLRSYAVITDVSALHKANEDLARTNRELDRFATVASHDLQEPLRKIAAFSSLLQRRYAEKLDADGIRNLEFLVDAAHRMQRLIDDLLAYSRLASLEIKPQPVDVRQCLDDVLANLDAAISESGAQITIGDMPIVQADPTLLAQILQNLISNAVKYRGEATPEIIVSAHPDTSGWVVSVQDNGIGLDVKFAEKIFAPFQRLHSRDAYKGTGIGLAIVRQAVERHNGKIWVESEEGRGSTFSVLLPGKLPQPAPDALHEEPAK
ncbi:PAS domain-containing protein [Maricaulis parjimensis]|uniref:PAS domain-containing protein n=1 Tax=Maricaulis parjimensis TaxID=144023 RepID=UPI001939CF2F